MSLNGFVKITVALVLSLGGAGCTVVHVHGAQGVQRSGWLGPLQVVGATPPGWYAMSIEGIGLVPGSSGATFGYRKEQFVTGDPAACRAVFFFERAADAASAIRLMHELQFNEQTICMIQPGGKP
ncbi:MAG TPA: hypothetical protein VGE60_05500 [Telluria sp.]